MSQIRDRERENRNRGKREADWNACRRCFRTLSQDDFAEYYFVCPHCEECFKPAWVPHHWRKQIK